MPSMRVLLDAETAGRGIRRMAGEIVERAGGAKKLALVGIRRGGVPLAAKLGAGAIPLGLGGRSEAGEIKSMNWFLCK